MLNSRVEKLRNEFNNFATWEDRYRHIMDLGKKLEILDEQYKIEKYRIKGCQSQVWFRPSLKNGLIELQADSDSVLVKGITAVLLQIYNHSKPSEILALDPGFLKEIGISEHLSMNRANGLASMVKHIQLYAQAFSALVAKGVLDADI